MTVDPRSAWKSGRAGIAISGDQIVYRTADGTTPGYRFATVERVIGHRLRVRLTCRYSIDVIDRADARIVERP